MKIKEHLLVYIAIVLITFLIYSPSLFQIPRADQLNYLHEMNQKHTLKELTIDAWDLTRTGVRTEGDELLFRPGLYFFLGLERYFFGYNFFLWQLTGLILHLVVLWQLMKLFLAIQKSYLAYFATLFFALFLTNVEMVSWHHISSYLLVLILILIALRQMVFAGNIQRSQIIVMSVCLGVSCFIYEMAVVWSMLFMMMTLWILPRERKLHALWIGASAVIYLVIYFSRMVLLPNQSQNQSFDVAQTLANLWSTLSFWFLSGSFPYNWNALVSGRLRVLDENWFNAASIVQTWQGWAALLLLGCVVWMMARGSRHAWNKHAPLIILVVGMILSLVLVVTIGRVNARGFIEGIGGSFYYHYIFWLLSFIGLYIFCAQIEFKKIFAAIAGIALAFNIYVHTQLTYHLLKSYEDAHRPAAVLLRTIELLIKEKGEEPNFSFYVDSQYPGNLEVLYKRKDDPQQVDRYSFIEILYPQYCKPQESAKYKLLVTK